MAYMDQVLILAVGLFGGSLDGDAILLGIGDHIASSLELAQPFRIFPRADDLHFRHMHVVAELKADLVISFSRSTMSYIDGAFLACDLYLALCDDRPCQTGSQHIGPFIDGIGFQCRENVVGDQLLAKILHIDFGGTGCQGLLLDCGEILVLSDVCDVGDDIKALVCKPFEND
ncbi:hypothetical protein SDC9_78241 [bioreactor metagenome]|uniref:Uncharacterized protein n=1 Tax=bioreactor metagenome TaxID=1076179 RepID=A0A644Z0G6_9ZZZZ